jgi:hypothetical protein
MLPAARLAAFLTCVAAGCIVSTASIDVLACHPVLFNVLHRAGSALIILSGALVNGAWLSGQLLAEQLAILAAATAIPAVLTWECAASVKVVVVRCLVCVHFSAATCYVLSFVRLQFPGTRAFAAGLIATLALMASPYVAVRFGKEAAHWC